MMSTAREYWRSSTTPFDENTPLTPLHEALHAAVAQLLGGEVEKISIKKGGEGWAIYSVPDRPWQDVATWLAPALIGDLSPGDEAWLKGQNPKRRGLKWAPETGWWVGKARAKRRSISKK